MLSYLQLVDRILANIFTAVNIVTAVILEEIWIESMDVL